MIFLIILRNPDFTSKIMTSTSIYQWYPRISFIYPIIFMVKICQNPTKIWHEMKVFPKSTRGTPSPSSTNRGI
jgi:hypothetical protein